MIRAADTSLLKLRHGPHRPLGQRARDSANNPREVRNEDDRRNAQEEHEFVERELDRLDSETDQATLATTAALAVAALHLGKPVQPLLERVQDAFEQAIDDWKEGIIDSDELKRRDTGALDTFADDVQRFIRRFVIVSWVAPHRSEQ